MMRQIVAAAQLLAAARTVACLTGAGVSAESGVATFRDSDTGLWSQFDPAQLASQQGFAADPGLVWRWYMQRLDKVSAVQPNPGHLALSELESLVPEFTLITQNVDDLHERSGSRSVLHLHGSISHFRCNACRTPYTLTHEDRLADTPPICPQCGDLVRPDVVWFGEMLPRETLAQAQRAAESCDIMLVVGTSGEVYPAAELPYVAQENGAAIIEVNPERTPITPLANVVLNGPSGEVLPRLLAQMTSRNAQSADGFQTN
jgi:NAD-dependent deacetylase